MAEKRDHQRINCTEKCLLYHADAKFSGMIMNISISGALVTLFDPNSDDIMPGDVCSLLLSNDPQTSFFRYKSRVARVHPAGVGLEILEYEF